MSNPQDIINIALAEVGYLEKASDFSLDDKNANAGDGNWTKYARDLYAAGYYNGNKNGFAWCDVFVDWCFYKAYGKDEGQRIQCQTGLLGAGCKYSAKYYQRHGRYDQTPKPGDQVFFYSEGTVNHTGIVVGVTDTTITTVEGNSGDRVKKNSYERINSYIAGFGHPLYSETEEMPAAVAEPEVASVPVECVVSLPLLRNGSKGNEVKSAQVLLIANGFPCGGPYLAGHEVPDGEFGPVTEKSVKQFQILKELQPDGIIGTVTWKTLLTS